MSQPSKGRTDRRRAPAKSIGPTGSVGLLPRCIASLMASMLLVGGLAGSVACSDGTKASPDKPGSSSSAKAVTSADLAAVDTSTLTPNEKKELLSQLGELVAPCANTPVPLSQCLSEKRDCKACAPAATFLTRLVRAGIPKSERATAYTDRFDPKAVKDIEIADSPFKGPEDAVVTIVEWADFECPHCMLMSPLLDSLVERFPGQVRVVYKFYPLSSIHKDGELAAHGAVAALDQKKFWEMHHALFGNQGKNDKAGILGLAKDLDLDMAQFKKDMNDDETTNRIDRDKKQADALGLDGTPLIYIAGRRVALEALTNPYDDLESWVKLDIEMAGKTPNKASDKFADPTAPGSAKPDAPPAPSESASAGPAASAAPSTGPKASSAPSAAPKGK